MTPSHIACGAITAAMLCGGAHHHRPPFARQACAGVNQPARPGRGMATVGPTAHAGGRAGTPGGPSAPGTAAGSAGFLLRYDHRAPFLPRMNPNMADLLLLDEGRPGRGMTGAARTQDPIAGTSPPPAGPRALHPGRKGADTGGCQGLLHSAVAYLPER